MCVTTWPVPSKYIVGYGLPVGPGPPMSTPRTNPRHRARRVSCDQERGPRASADGAAINRGELRGARAPVVRPVPPSKGTPLAHETAYHTRLTSLLQK